MLEKVITGRGQVNLRWPPQFIHLSQHKNGYSSVDFVYIKLNCCAVVADSYSLYKLQALKDDQLKYHNIARD